MALDPSSRYPAQTDSDAGYPLGKARNAGAFQDGSGTPLEQDWVNDIWGFQQALLDAAELEPSGDPDKVGASQYLEALEELFSAYTPTTPEDWPDPPVAVAGALDALAAEMPREASDLPYTPDIAGDWSSPAPATVAAALDASADVTRRLLTNAVLELREIREEGELPGDTSDFCAAISLSDSGTPNPALGLALIKGSTNATWIVSSQGATVQPNAMQAITSNLAAAARATSGRILVVGDGGNDCAYSDNNGATWTAGGSVGAVATDVVFTNSRFVAVSASNVFRSIDGDTWGAVSDAALDSLGCGIAAYDTGHQLVCGLHASSGAGPRFARALSTGFVVETQTVPNPGDYSDAGWVAGNGGAHAWHVGRANSGAELRVSRKTAIGGNWSLIATIAAPSPATFNAKPRVLVCQDTGLMVVVAPTNSNGTALYASLDGGLSWLGPRFAGGAPITAFAVAGGRLLSTRRDMLFASDGIGWG